MRQSSNADIFLAVLLSALAHYSVVTALPKARLPQIAERADPVELELVAPRTEAERAAPMPEISLPQADLSADDVPEPLPIPALPTPATAAPAAETVAPEERHPEKLPDTFLQSVDLENTREEETPEDPHFLAQSNMNVEEETVAHTRSLSKNDPAPEPSGREPGDSEQPGDGEEEVIGHDQAQEGETHEQIASASHPNQPPPIAEVEGRPAQEEVAAVEPSAASGFTGDSAGDLSVSGREAEEGREAQEGTAGRRSGARPNLKLSWGQFNQLYGADQLAAERQAIAERRRASTKGRHRVNWERTRAAIENYVPHVRTGNQTALRAAHSPFARYLSDMHRRIHHYWADGYLIDLLSLGDHHPLNDFNLRTDLEIVVDQSGNVAQVGVVRTSGQMQFDAAAVDSAYRSGPHPSPPREILSGDGRVYLHWGFYRNARQCGTFNATPFLLPDPPTMPRDTADPPAEGESEPAPAAPEMAPTDAAG